MKKSSGETDKIKIIVTILDNMDPNSPILAIITYYYYS